MVEKHVDFSVTATDSLRYWLTVDESGIELVNGIGGCDLEESKEHVLVWSMTGNPGDALSIVGTQGLRTVVTVKDSKIPAGSSKGDGYRRFQV